MPTLDSTRPPRTERTLLALVVAAVAANLACAAIAVFQLSVGSDEAWSLTSALAVARPADPDLAVPVVLTNGGLYAAAHALLAGAGTTALWAHRMISLAALLATLALAGRFASRRCGTMQAGWIAAGGLLATPGAVILGATALAEMLAALLLLVSCLVVWREPRDPQLKRVLAVAALAGLLAATRATAIPILAAFAPWLTSGGAWRKGLLRCAAFGGVAAAVYLAAQIGYLAASSPKAMPTPETVLISIGLLGDARTGETRAFLDPGPLVHRFAIANAELPLLALALITFASLWLAARERDPRGLGSAARLLVGFGWLGWCAWLLVSPLSFLRYLWPALPAFGLAGGLVAASTFVSSRDAWLRALCLVLVIAALGSQLVVSLHSFVRGGSTLLVEHWSVAPDMGMFWPPEVKRSQEAAARFLRERVPRDADIGVFEHPFALRYLSGRRVRWMPAFEGNPKHARALLPRWLVLTPAVGTTLHFSDAGYAWFAASCRLAAQFDGYAIYQVVGEYPEDLRVLQRSKVARSRHPLARERGAFQLLD